MNEGSSIIPANAGAVTPPNAAAAISISREAAEVITQMQIAHAYPRDVQRSLDRILMACTRPKLAEAAVYTYAKGGQDITGPSIRLAEAIAQNWGNMSAGVREIEQRNNGSMCEAFAIDYETNTRMTKVFFVSHIRHTKKGDYLITDPRDIYEMVANNGARRMRACILAIVPGDIVEEAITQCTKTIAGGQDEVSKETIMKLVKAFAPMGVSASMIERYLMRNLDAMTPAQLVKLRGIYQSIKDGMSKPEKWFEAETVEAKSGDAKKETPAETFKKATESARKAMGKGKTHKEPVPPVSDAENGTGGDSGEDGDAPGDGKDANDGTFSVPDADGAGDAADGEDGGDPDGESDAEYYANMPW